MRCRYPTMLVAFARYSSFTSLRANLGFVVAMTAGTILGGLLLGLVSASVLIPLLALLLILSAVKAWRH
ncbi:hypothetical protein E0H73_38670 [Kribbella pittospori]|uniref:Uncharacterized protein n=1 Tax=Kribbella pittospori TaxID=722689 RepID=A0A4R0K309_9ACTN|nr:hypothetical protein [Kribbella pittospori]TCC54381.1 hypothetical protein E0H73_38670 [Kribbella pittospori]